MIESISRLYSGEPDNTTLSNRDPMEHVLSQKPVARGARRESELERLADGRRRRHAAGLAREHSVALRDRLRDGTTEHMRRQAGAI